MTLNEQIQSEYCPDRPLSTRELKVIEAITDHLLDKGVPPTMDVILPLLHKQMAKEPKKEKKTLNREDVDEDELRKSIAEQLGVSEDMISVRAYDLSDSDKPLSEALQDAMEADMDEDMDLGEYHEKQVISLLKIRKAVMLSMLSVESTIDESLIEAIYNDLTNTKAKLENAITFVSQNLSTAKRKELGVQHYIEEWEELM